MSPKSARFTRKQTRVSEKTIHIKLWHAITREISLVCLNCFFHLDVAIAKVTLDVPEQLLKPELFSIDLVVSIGSGLCHQRVKSSRTMLLTILLD